MPFFKAVGLGIFFLVLAIAMPQAFGKLEETVLVVLDTFQGVLEQAESFTASPASLSVPSVEGL